MSDKWNETTPARAATDLVAGTLNKRIAELEKQLKAQRASYRTLTDTCKTQHEYINQLKDQLASVQAAYQKADQASVALLKDNGRLETELATARHQNKAFMEIINHGKPANWGETIEIAWEQLQAAEGERDTLRARLERLEAALKFYADPASYKQSAGGEPDHWGNCDTVSDPDVWLDEGEIAREALDTTTPASGDAGINSDLNIEKAAEILRERKHKGAINWQVLAESGDWWVEGNADHPTLAGEKVSIALEEFEAIAIAREYLRQAGEGGGNGK